MADIDAAPCTGSPFAPGSASAGGTRWKSGLTASSNWRTSGLRYWVGVMPTALVNRLVNVPTLL
ncbi:hypothetical protein [Amycolatopsis sp. MtRt-6]|uniref:hypothetical protein n=1 Tax=Amycolatopsis sp. MtRt-6 TaxID=2792782 RepID=UPI001F5DDC16|nr:hypothetical protein [Amycolatopsis sp. MtRt-6]